MNRYVSLLLIYIALAHGLKINDVQGEGDAPKKVLPSSLLQASDAFAAIKDAGAALLKGDHKLAKKAGKTAMLATVGTFMQGAAKVAGINLSEDDMNSAIHKAQNSQNLHKLLDKFFTDVSTDDLKKFPESVSLLQQKMAEDPHKIMNQFNEERKKRQEKLDAEHKKKQEEKKAQKQKRKEDKAKEFKESHEKNRAEKQKVHEDRKAAKEQTHQKVQK